MATLRIYKNYWLKCDVEILKHLLDFERFMFDLEWQDRVESGAEYEVALINLDSLTHCYKYRVRRKELKK